MPPTPVDWHDRFTQQAGWTHSLRQHLYTRAGLERARRVLDVGCGTGVLLPELTARSRSVVYGLDVDRAYLIMAMRKTPTAVFSQGDAHRLPFPAAAFDLCLCHFLLLWARDPESVVHEMARVTRTGGCVLALAEPDYGGRIDHPPELATLGRWQAEALRQQGANPEIGRQLSGLFTAAGLVSVESGVLGGQWSGAPSRREWETEWAVLRSDLSASIPSETLDQLQARDAQAWKSGQRVLFVPTFYAWGQVP